MVVGGSGATLWTDYGCEIKRLEAATLVEVSQQWLCVAITDDGHRGYTLSFEAMREHIWRATLYFLLKFTLLTNMKNGILSPRPNASRSHINT